jgi:hypothetical protein
MSPARSRFAGHRRHGNFRSCPTALAAPSHEWKHVDRLCGKCAEGTCLAAFDEIHPVFSL